jgi:2-succinyl-5-enolpyruvyl-6-hydroxy-3-cyclohexene-1-carboxylate synthase
LSVPTTDGGRSAADTQAAFASTMVDEWVRGGVTYAVVCPGSRSTPLVMALADHPGMVVHVRLDERSAGFTALGIGQATGHPALIVTTSGTAAAELHPAVVEADLAGVPLIACTADRPPELRDVGAPQAIDQTHLFARSPRWFCDPGVPTPGSRASWRSLAARSVAAAMSGPGGPGPVHLNLPFREPLLGDPVAGGMSPGRPDGRPWHEVVSGPQPPPDGGVASLVASGALDPDRRGLIVAGAGCGEPTAVLALSAALSWPILADPRSGLRGVGPYVIAAADGILRSDRFARAHAPEAVLGLGERWVSRVVNTFVSASIEDGARSVRVDPWGRWPDPGRETAAFIRCDPTLFCQGAVWELGRLGPGGLDPAAQNRWRRDWQDAETDAQAAIGDALEVGTGADDRDRGGQLSEPSLARRLLERLPSAATLVVSSSMPIRDVEAFTSHHGRPPRVLANRGANGIDGVVSTALGVALGSSSPPGPLSSASPTVALVGDLAFLHDVSALVHADDFGAALTVVVADNGGGGIFSFLEPASVLDPDSFDALFGTPQSPDVAAVAASFGWPVDDVGPDAHRSEFEEALDRRLAMGGPSVIRVRLPGRTENVAIHNRINAAIVEAVEAVDDGGSGRQASASRVEDRTRE